MFLSRSLLLTACTLLFLFNYAMAEEAESRARRLMNALGCKACHSFEQSGSIIAPALTRIGARLSLEQLEEKLTLHQDNNSLMPSYETTPAEDLKAILIFLSERK